MFLVLATDLVSIGFFVFKRKDLEKKDDQVFQAENRQTKV